MTNFNVPICVEIATITNTLMVNTCIVNTFPVVYWLLSSSWLLPSIDCQQIIFMSSVDCSTWKPQWQCMTKWNTNNKENLFDRTWLIDGLNITSQLISWQAGEAITARTRHHHIRYLWASSGPLRGLRLRGGGGFEIKFGHHKLLLNRAC